MRTILIAFMMLMMTYSLAFQRADENVDQEIRALPVVICRDNELGKLPIHLTNDSTSDFVLAIDESGLRNIRVRMWSDESLLTKDTGLRPSPKSAPKVLMRPGDSKTATINLFDFYSSERLVPGNYRIAIKVFDVDHPEHHESEVPSCEFILMVEAKEPENK